MKTEDLENNLQKDGIDLDNPEHVDYLYRWAQHREKAYETLKKQLSISIAKTGQLVEEKIELKDIRDELVEALEKATTFIGDIRDLDPKLKTNEGLNWAVKNYTALIKKANEG